MAKALFHRGQRVFVKPVATWAVVERIVPHWVKGVEEPIRVYYDVGLGREFAGSELLGEPEPHADDLEGQTWRVLRLRNRMGEELGKDEHPFPGTFPVVVTDELDWGGWRVPSAEYEREPRKIEHQALVIAHALKMLRITRAIARFAEDSPARLPEELRDVADQAQRILSAIYQPRAAPQAADPAARRL